MYPFFVLKFSHTVAAVRPCCGSRTAGNGLSGEKQCTAGGGAERMCDSMRKGCDTTV